MTSPTKVALLACGSYNPITNMHLRMFEIARDNLNRLGRYKVIQGMISPVHDSYGKNGLIAASHRCAMVKLALKTSDWVRLDSWESEEESWLETKKVLEHHQKNLNNSMLNENEAPNKKSKLDGYIHNDDVDNRTTSLNLNQPIEVKLLCGADLLESFGKPGVWKEEDITEIVSRFGLVVVTRQGSNPYKFIYESDILTKYQHNIHIVTEWISNEISATKIRRALNRGESVKYLMQDSVLDYIKANMLYGWQETKYNSILLTPSPNFESDVSMEPLNTVVRIEDSELTQHGVCMPRFMDIICNNNNQNSRSSRAKNPHLSTLV